MAKGKFLLMNAGPSPPLGDFDHFTSSERRSALRPWLPFPALVAALGTGHSFRIPLGHSRLST